MVLIKAGRICLFPYRPWPINWRNYAFRIPNSMKYAPINSTTVGE